MKFKTTQFLILIVIANVAIGAGYYWFFNLIKTETETASELSIKINAGEQRNSRLNNLQSIVKETEMDRHQLATFFLQSGSEVAFIDQIEALARTSGLSEKTANVDLTNGLTANTKILQMQIAATGSWSNIMYFLGQLENLPYNINIKGISLIEQPSESKSKNDIGVWTGSYDISVAEQST